METRVDKTDFVLGNYLIVHPMIAKQIGLNESIVIQEIHSFLKAKNEPSHRELCKIFPFWSEEEVENIVLDLEEAGIVTINDTGHYLINYEVLDSILRS